LIENCHWGGDLPTLTWCPFNFFRTSGDISASWNSFFSNLQTTIKFQDYDNPLSRPGCWAYPDMLEVGNLPTYSQDRAHFGAWCIVSAPLILGFDITNSNTMNQVWDIITNPEAIAVSQAWADHPGMLVKSWNPSPPGDQTYMWAVDCSTQDVTQVGFKYDSGSKAVLTPDGLCVDSTQGAELTGAKCSGSAKQQYNYTSQQLLASNGQCVDVYDFSGPVLELYNCNGGCNQHFTFNSDGTLRDTCSPQKCIASRQSSPSGGDILQLWAKPQNKGAVAALVLNSDPANSYTVQIDLKSLNLTTSTVAVRDIWLRKDLGTASGTFTTDAIPGYDSRFYLFTPQ